MSYEHIHQPLLSRKQWLIRVLRSLRLASLVVGCALGLGVLGYHLIGGLGWIDALLEASMILGGMGAIAPMHTDAIKLFASFYALFSGLVIVSTMGIILAPWLHRILHHFHAGDNDL
jgi:hypothetical protein